MTNLGALTTTYTPTGADCTSTYIGANNDNQWIQYGQPNTTECVPPNFTAFEDYYYSPGLCPSGYTYACQAGVGSSTTQATCCPSGFACRGADYTRDTDPFACASYYTSNTYLSAEYYKLSSETDGTTTGPASASSTSTTWYIDGSSGFYVEAYGPIVRRSAGDPEWSGSGAGATGTTASDAGASTARSSTGSGATGTAASSTGAGGGGSAQSDTGLSVGASAGIGVGVGLGCIIFIGCIAAAYIIGKRKRNAQKKDLDPLDVPQYREGVPVNDQVAELNSGWRPWELQGKDYQQVVEMDGQAPRSELGSASLPVELPGQAPSSDYYGHARQ